MITYTPQQYQDILYGKLPQEVRDVVLNSDTTRALWKIGERHKLQIDKVGIMHDMAMDVMMGIIATKNFVQELQKELEIPAFDASTLARDIDDEIFKPIKTTMIKMYGDGAPYRPSSSLVQFYEEDEGHHALDKDVLLREIENPAQPIVRKEEVKTMALETAEEVKELKEMEDKINPPHPDPLLNKERVPAPIGEAGEGKPQISMLDKIASLKLSQTIVMPRKEAEINSPLEGSTAKPIGAARRDVNPISSAFQAPPSKEESKTPAPKSTSPDPYREPLA